MDLRKFLWLLIVINTLGIRIPSSSIPSSLADQLVNTLKSCFADRLNPVIITDDLIEIVYKETTDFPVHVIDKDFTKSVANSNPRYPTYVLSVNSVQKLEETLQKLANLSTWSIESVFLLVGHSNCDQNGRQVLELLWNINQLTAFFICSKSIYTINPFSNRVPLPWKQVPDQSQYQNKENRPMLFKRPYENDPKLCLSLTFEKTKHLDGYPVKAIVDSSFKKMITQNKTLQVEDLRKILPYNHYKYLKTIFSSLKVTLEIDRNNVDNYSSNNVSYVVLNQLVNGSVDICLNIKSITIPGYEQVDILNPKILNNMFILINPRGAQKSIPSQFSLVNLTFVLAIVFALLVSYLVIIINKINNLNLNNDDDPEYGNSFLEILRFIISTGILTPLNSRSMRIMFITTTLIVYVISPELQGKITSSSTKQEYSYPAGIEDLFDLNYTVYINKNLRKIFIERKNEFNTNVNRLHSFAHSKHECYQRIMKDPTIACVYFNQFQVEMALKHNFPLILVSEIDRYNFFWSKKNWLLKKKIDSITRSLDENGILPYWDRKNIYLPLKKLRAKEASKPLSEYIPTEFDDLKLLYILLGSLTLGLSIFVFLAELLVSKIITRRRQRVDCERLRKLRARARRYREQNVNDRFLQDKVRIVRGRVVILP